MTSRSIVFRRHLLRTLEGHGLTPGAARSARVQGVKLREETILRKVEHGVLIDAAIGDQVDGVVVGTAVQVDAERLLWAMQPERQYVFIHTHPLGYSFTPLDVAVLAAHWPRLRVIVAVGGQGVWYVASVLPDRTAPSPAAVREAFERARDETAPRYETRVQAGDLTRREAQRRLTHDVWEHIAPNLGVRYDRIT
jgi:hypothetical protein